MGKTNWDFSIIKTGHVLIRICDVLRHNKASMPQQPNIKHVSISSSRRQGSILKGKGAYASAGHKATI